MTEKSKILFIDDEKKWHTRLKGPLRKKYLIRSAYNINTAVEEIERDKFDLVLLDLNLKGNHENIDKEYKRIEEGLNNISVIKKIDESIPIIIVTADRHIANVVTAMKMGAENFFHKGSFDIEQWQNVFEKCLEYAKSKIEIARLKTENETLKRDNKELVNKDFPFIGESNSITEIKRTLEIVGEDPNIAILITGETGVGKEVAARYFHANSIRHEYPFVAVHLSAITKDLLESTLFGHKKGAFTGAISDFEGYFRQANGGIIFLDEIGDIDADIQIKLLRFLETKRIKVVGDTKNITLDVQIIAATNKNLQEEVEQGTFRMDLYQRLKAYPIELPPLRERQEDILSILRLYMNRQSHIAVGDIREIDNYINHSAKEKILGYNWPGNVRELRNAVPYMFTRKKVLRKKIIDIACLPIEIQEYQPIQSQIQNAFNNNAYNLNLNVGERPYYTELQEIETMLLATNGNKSEAVKRLGKKNLDQLRNRIKAIYKKHAHLFVHFPKTCECYKISV